MATIDDDVAVEPFDVLLEEVALELPADVADGTIGTVTGPPPRRRWLAVAAMLLGTTAVLGTIWLQRRSAVVVVPAQDPRPAPKGQEPQPAPRVPVPNPLLERLEQARREAARNSTNKLLVQLPDLSSPEVQRVHDPAKRRALLRTITTIRLDVLDRDSGQVVLGQSAAVEPDRVAPLCTWLDEAWGESADVVQWRLTEPFACQLVLQSADGGTHTIQVQLDPPLLRWNSLDAPHLNGQMHEELASLYRQATRAGRLQRGEAADLDELRALPATATAIRCPCLTAEQARAELPRFERLERLAFVEQGMCPLPHGATVGAIARLRTLRALELPAGMLDDDDLRALATLPELDELALTGATAKVTADGLAALQRLTTLRLLVRECDPRLLDALKRLPRLRSFAAHGPWFRDEQIDALLPTKIASLEFASGDDFGSSGPTDTWITAAGLRRLAGLPSLRQLVLVHPRLDQDGVAALQALQLRQLVLRGPTTWFAEDADKGVNRILEKRPGVLLGIGAAGRGLTERLRAALPQCEVVHEELPAAPVLRKE